MEIKKIAVIGGGLMGRQIALCASIHGVDATVYDLKPEVLEAVDKWEKEYMAGRIAKGRMTEAQVAEAESRFHIVGDLAEAVKDVDCVIEAIIEVQEVKASVIRQLDKLIRKDCIIATNSSAMVSSLFADCMEDPSRLCNMHFYNPALVMKFVEVVQGPHTSTETAQAVYDLALKMEKKPIWQKKEIAGFAGNYLIGGLIERARYLVENGYCTPQEVDTAQEYGFNHKMGTFRMNDLTGIDLGFTMMKTRYERTGKKPDMYDVYEQMVKENKLGRKTGIGFYDYRTNPNGEAPASEVIDVTPYRDLNKIAVIGGGLMGRQIALCAAICGVDATVYDLKPEVLEAVDKWEKEYMAGRIAKGRMTEAQVAEAESRFHIVGDLEAAVKDVDCVIEAIIEVKDVKASVIRQLDKLIRKDCIIATNSSYMVSSLFADCMEDPSRLCNMHFYNPALVMKFVEVVQGPHTSTETAGAIFKLAKRMGKMPIWQKKEIAGFAGNYLVAGLSQRAKYLVQNGYCTAQEVDTALEFGFNHKMGVFRMNDLTGIDLSFTMMKATYERTGEKPDMYDIYEQMVKENKLGRKTGHGFYDYV
ncbi:MAG: 3-hydroxyacyl-CoA dehydrogenase family protein [Ruminococcaceae bacterium]|nr:3-hydroxyacyl-CoA dehydrogenase family protein [Oscillospiraceae bacterium]